MTPTQLKKLARNVDLYLLWDKNVPMENSNVGDVVTALREYAALLEAKPHQEAGGPQSPIVKLTVGDDDSLTATMYAPGLPPGEFDLYCEPPTPGGEKVPFCKPAEPVCAWAYDEDGLWQTGCGNTFLISDGTLEENGMNFCCYCGKNLPHWNPALEKDVSL